MLEELQHRNYSHHTAKIYVRVVRDFATYFHQPPDKLGPEQIRQYQAHLFQSKKLAPATVSQHLSAVRFLFIKTLHRHFLAEHSPFPKSRKRLPTVLSPEEVARLIDSARNLYHRTLLMTLYSTAMRRAELCSLKVRDVDSQRMMIRRCDIISNITELTYDGKIGMISPTEGGAFWIEDGYTNLIRVPLASLTRLVVHPDFRRLGLSTLLDGNFAWVKDPDGNKIELWEPSESE
jgi:GNAT superfamily N-acetyltransferase